jgi:hypothetical protein
MVYGKASAAPYVRRAQGEVRLTSAVRAPIPTMRARAHAKEAQPRVTADVRRTMRSSTTEYNLG